jgi:methionyl-tRNA formyltransferase
MGTPNFAVPVLKSLYSSKHKILEVYTQPPKKKIVAKK